MISIVDIHVYCHIEAEPIYYWTPTQDHLIICDEK